jgi:hypothetical protein
MTRGEGMDGDLGCSMAVGAFVSDCFENEVPATSEIVAHFLQSEMSRSILLDAIRHVLPRHLCFKTVPGMPTERETIDLDPWGMGDFDIRSYGAGNEIPSATLANLNETKNWADRKDIRAVCPVSCDAGTIDVRCAFRNAQSAIQLSILRGG